MDASLSIVDIIENNTITRLSQTYQHKLLNKDYKLLLLLQHKQYTLLLKLHKQKDDTTSSLPSTLSPPQLFYHLLLRPPLSVFLPLSFIAGFEWGTGIRPIKNKSINPLNFLFLFL